MQLIQKLLKDLLFLSRSPWKVCILLLIVIVYGIVWIGILSQNHLPLKRNILVGQHLVGRISPSIDHDVPIVSDWGDDSQFFWAFSLDPFLNNISIKESIDSPSYRSQRILLPFLTWCIIRDPSHVLYGLWFWSIIGYIIGVLGVYKLCIHFKINSSLPVILFLFNPGVINSILHPMSDTLSVGLFLIALSFWVRDKKWIAATLFALACLTREYYAIYIFFISLFSIRPFKSINFYKILPLALSGIPMLIWQCVIRWRLGVWSFTQSHRNFDWPCFGTIKACLEHHKISNDIVAVSLLLISMIMIWMGRLNSKYFPWYLTTMIAMLMIISGPAIMESSSSSIRISIPLIVFASFVLLVDHREHQSTIA